MILDLKVGDLLIVLATLAGPILAVQAQKLIERATAAQRGRLDVFYTLMATRGTRLALSHVQALNRIELEFSEVGSFGLLIWRKKREAAVLDCWKEYSAKLSEPLKTNDDDLKVWLREASVLFVDLLFEMSKSLGFSFTKLQIQQSYNPMAHGDAEASQKAVQTELLAILTGKNPIKMEIVAFPTSDEALNTQKKVQAAILKSMDADGRLKVVISDTKNLQP